MKQTTSAQQVIDRLTERWAAKHSRPPVNCTLGREPRRRRGGACSACTAPQEFELDQEVAQLIKTGAFKGTGVCPYQVITSHLVAALAFGPEAFRARSAGQYRVDPVVEIKGALKRIGTITARYRLDPGRHRSPQQQRRLVGGALRSFVGRARAKNCFGQIPIRRSP